MQAVKALEHPDEDDTVTGSLHHVPTVVDGVVSAFDLFSIQRPMHCRRCLRALAEPRPNAVTEAWNILGTAMYEAMGRLVTEPADEQR